jgi:hypothetical protein
MSYIFNIVGVSPVLNFFDQSSVILQQPQFTGVEYIPNYHCTLDALVESAEAISLHNHWDSYEVIDTVVNYWMHNVDRVRYWKRQLYQAGPGYLLISRVAELDALRTELDFLLNCQIAGRNLEG